MGRVGVIIAQMMTVLHVVVNVSPFPPLLTMVLESNYHYFSKFEFFYYRSHLPIIKKMEF